MKRILTNRRLAGAGLLAAFAASLCCITPVLAIVAGVGSGLSALSWLEPLRPLFIGLTVLALGFAWFQQIRPRKEIDCDCETKEKQSFLQTKKFLTIVTILAALLLAFPYYSSVLFAVKRSDAKTISVPNVQRVDLKIKGMTCEGCETNINHAISLVDGVLRVESDYKRGEAKVQYDASKTEKEEIVAAVKGTGYEIEGATDGERF